MNGSTPGTRSGRRTLRDAPPPGVLMIATRSAAGFAKMLPARVAIDDVRTDDLHLDRHAAARVDDAADVPAAEQRPATSRSRRCRTCGPCRREASTAG